MPSPFPGMNPFLENEDVWSDFHLSFMVELRNAIAPQVRPEYYTRLDSHDYFVESRFGAIRCRSSYLQIRTLQNTILSVIELVKAHYKVQGKDRDDFLTKRREILQSDVQYVEIDLRRGGERMPVEQLPESDYYVMVSRSERRHEPALWPLRLRDRLPVIPVPLPVSNRDASVDLQEVLNQLYDASFYGIYIYREPPQPRLSADDEAWAKAFLPTTLA